MNVIYNIRASAVAHKPSLPATRVVGHHERFSPSDVLMCYSYAPGKLQCALTTHSVPNVVQQGGQPALYYPVPQIATLLCLLPGSFAKSC